MAGSEIAELTRDAAPAAPFRSILFPDGAGGRTEGLPAFLADLNLDQVLTALAGARPAHDLIPLFAEALTDPDAIAFRHEVFRDLETEAVRQAVDAFAARMTGMREHLRQAAAFHHRRQGESAVLDAVGVYCMAVRELAERLSSIELRSRGLRGLRDHLQAHSVSEEFRVLASEAADLRQRLAGVTYSLRIRGNRVIVNNHAGEPDLSREVEAVFDRFQQGATKDYRVTFANPVEMNHVEAMILDRVAQLNAELFAQLSAFCSTHAAFVDPVVGRFEREVHFYLSYLDLMGTLRTAGLELCYPEVSASSRHLLARDTFDIALAAKLVAAGRPVVCNDVELGDGESVFVVTGPNQGGKTTFARTLGQLHHLARLGVPVPGRSARLLLCDRVFTHFQREERVTDLRSNLQDELIRVREILSRATSRSVVIMNESLASTTADDALFLGREVIRRLLERGVIGVYVTFIDELTTAFPGLVSMVSTVFPDDPVRRTFKVVRREADGRAYALAIAEKYRLTYDQLRERVGQ